MSLRRQHPAAHEDEHPTIRLVDSLLARALELGASDLHVSPSDAGGAAVARVDGYLREIRALSADELPRVIARLKVLAGLPAFRTAEPQDGALVVETASGRTEARIATVPVLGGEKAAVRFLDPAGAPRELSDLGLTVEAQGAVSSLLDMQDGLVIVIGPCSSGKSTTLRAMARAIVRERGAWTHVAAVEDPVESRLPGVTHVEVDRARGLDFPRALAALLRQDPQVLLVGETRDAETARMAMEAAFTGHLVLTSFHVGRLDDAARRLSLLGIEERLVAEGVAGVVNQRLLRRRCGTCGGEGCATCAGSGHRGRFVIAEVARRMAGVLRLVTPSLAEAARCASDSLITTPAEIARALAVEGRAS